VLDLQFEIQKILAHRGVEQVDLVQRPAVNVAKNPRREAVQAFQELRHIVRANLFLFCISKESLDGACTISLSFGHGPTGMGSNSYSSFWVG
jgi:hypothetical protein